MSGTQGYRAYASDDLVTGEGVAVEVPAATLPMRIVSGLIDALVSLVAFCLGGMVVSFAVGGQSEAMGRASVIALVVGTFVGIPVLLETVTSGRTLGKLALGLRTVRDDGGPIRFRHALTRGLVGFPEIWMSMGLVAFVSGLLSTRAKRLGDYAAGTHVIAVRRSVSLAPPPEMPPPLAAWARSADIGTLPEGLAIAVRQHLARAGTMTPQARETVGRGLLEAVLEHVSPRPPVGAPMESVLAAVIADRRRRDLERLRRDDALRRRVLSPDPLDPRPRRHTRA